MNKKNHDSLKAVRTKKSNTLMQYGINIIAITTIVLTVKTIQFFVMLHKGFNGYQRAIDTIEWLPFYCVTFIIGLVLIMISRRNTE